MASIKLIIRPDKMNTVGEAPIHLRITQNRKTIQISTGERVDPIFWDPSGKIKRGHPNSQRLTQKLSHHLAEAKDNLLKQEQQHIILTQTDIKDTLRGYKQEDFFQFADRLLTKSGQREAFTNQRRKRSLLAKFRAFIPTEGLLIHEVNVSLLCKYENYLKGMGNRINTIHGAMKFIQMVMRHATLQDIIRPSQNPFHEFQIKTEKSSRIYLTEDQLDAIRLLELPEGSREELSRDIFIFACYAGGIRVSDLLLLKRENYQNGHLTYRMRKTRTPIQRQPISRIAIALAEKYAYRTSDDLPWLFPVIRQVDDHWDEVKTHYVISGNTSIHNRHLKNIARKAGLPGIRLSSHIARHSFATLMLSKNQSIETVANILRHANIRETQIYAKVMDKAVADAMNAL